VLFRSKLMDRTSNPKGVQNPKYGKLAKEKKVDEESTIISSGKSTVSDAGGDSISKEEMALFVDPYAVLSEIAGGVTSKRENGTQKQGALGSDTSDLGISGGTAFHDPFDPSSWNMDFGIGEGKMLDPEDGEGKSKQKNHKEAMQKQPEGKMAAKNMPSKTMMPDSESVAEQMKDKIASQQSSKTEKLVQSMKEAIAEIVNDKNWSGPNVTVSDEGTGAMISLSDAPAEGMFDVGSARPKPAMVKLMGAIGKLLARKQGMITISGHTDGRQYKSGGYDNWRLSTSRAHMARYMLVRGGLPENRVGKIEGHADTKLKFPENRNSAANRRIEIFLTIP